jgi:hypothetical protein
MNLSSQITTHLMTNVSDSIKSAFDEYHVARQYERLQELSKLESRLVFTRQEYQRLEGLPTFRAVPTVRTSLFGSEMSVVDFKDQLKILRDMERDLGVAYTSQCTEKLGELFQASANIIDAYEQMRRPLPVWFRDRYTWDDGDEDQQQADEGSEESDDENDSEQELE